MNFAPALQSHGASNDAEAIEGIYAVGYDFIERENWGDASDVFRAMLLLAPRDERAWVALGQCHERQGQEQIAVELYSMGILAIPTAVRCRIALARALEARGDSMNADSVLDAAENIASESNEDELVDLVRRERGGRS